MLDALLQLFQWRIYWGCSHHVAPKSGRSLCICVS